MERNGFTKRECLNCPLYQLHLTTGPLVCVSPHSPVAQFLVEVYEDLLERAVEEGEELEMEN